MKTMKLYSQILLQSLIYLCFILGQLAFAQQPQLIVTAEPDHVQAGETFTLQVMLNNLTSNVASSTLSPDLQPLNGKFNILNQQASEYTQSYNGQLHRQLIWSYIVEPLGMGTVTIPALSLTTPEGTFSSQPLNIEVKAGVNKDSSAWLETSVSTNKPALYQPVFYTLRFYHQGDLMDLRVLPPDSDIVLEQLPAAVKNEKREINGKTMQMAEVTYVITPMKSGTLEIKAAQIVGQKMDGRRTNGGFFSYTTTRPVRISGEPLTLQVQAPTQQPWLPANQVSLTQQWETPIEKSVVVGTPLIRTLTLKAEGTGAQPLPELSPFLQEQAGWRVRLPKAETKREVAPDGKTLVSTLSQNMSITPLQVGNLRLPALQMAWWDIQQQKIRWAELPEQVINVVNDPNAPVASPQAVTGQITVITDNALSSWQKATLFLALIALVIALFTSLNQRLNFKTLSLKYLAYFSLFPKTQKYLQWGHINSGSELKMLVLDYAMQEWGVKQVSLTQLAEYVQTHFEQSEALARLLRQLEQSLYGAPQQQTAFSLETWQHEFQHCIQKLQTKEKRIENTLTPMQQISKMLNFS